MSERFLTLLPGHQALLQHGGHHARTLLIRHYRWPIRPPRRTHMSSACPKQERSCAHLANGCDLALTNTIPATRPTRMLARFSRFQGTLKATSPMMATGILFRDPTRL